MDLIPVLAFPLLALFVLAGCTSPIAQRVPAEPTTDDAGGGAPDPPAPPGGLRICMTCGDALAGATGAVCDEKPIGDLEVCGETRCLDDCDDNLFWSLGDPAKAKDCRECLAARCGGELKACREDGDD